MKFIPFFLILLQCLLRIPTITSQTNCNNDYGNFTASSSFGDNRDLILTSLYTNSTAEKGSYSGSIGAGNSTVYVISFCMGDVTQEKCTSCLNATALDLIRECPNQKKALSWGDGCTVRYSGSQIYGTYEDDPKKLVYNTGDITMNQTEFDEIWLNLTRGLAVNASKGSFELKYATGETILPNFKTIFALMQCSPDMSETYCRTCLTASINDYQGCCRGRQGGVVAKPSCIFRWDLYPFYASKTAPPPPFTSQTQLQPTAPPPLAISPNITGVDRGTNDSSTRKIITIVAAVVAGVSLALITCILVVLKKRRKTKLDQIIETALLGEALDGISEEESLLFDLATVKAATDNFSDATKVGQGGFGTVYKGKLTNGKEVAVKRLSANSVQGALEFKNEVMLLAKLQHRNLVRLLGFCLEGAEKILIYEFVPNSSLDNFIFDPVNRRFLDWKIRHKIIMGIARGILYLHEDSRLRIIHRDLKPSNVLLDKDMNPKISDFGMAKLFSQDQTRADTSRVVGTYGYMAPEYVMLGNYSVKTDVFSFGVLLLEIVSGQKNNKVQNGDSVEILMSYVWKNWREGTLSSIIDPYLNSSSSAEIVRFIHIGLLCVQENVTSRPTMASVFTMLSSQSLYLQVPSQPAFFLQTAVELDTATMSEYSRDSSNNDDVTVKNPSQEVSMNEQSFTDPYPR